jgi:hypothetical protein
MPISAKVPAPFAPLFDAAEGFVSKLFSSITRKPEAGTVHVGDERYVLMRAESFYVSGLV